MAILFESFGKAVALDHEEPERLCRVIMFDELKTCDAAGFENFPLPDVLENKHIELRQGAYTDEEYAAIMNGEPLLSINWYGRKWRAWDGGKPYPEQMLGTEWEYEYEV